MNADVHRFKVGAFACLAISDGTLAYAPPMFPPPPIFLFANAPRERLDLVLREHNLQPERWAAWVSPYICAVVDTGAHKVLVDTGADGLGPDTGKLFRNLEAAGMTPEEIDTVVLTHGHPDHIGGNTDAEGNLAFPKARYVMWKDEWEFWTTQQAELELPEQGRELLVNLARRNLLPIAGQLDLVDHETEIVPGLQAIAAPGHTAGHIAIAVSSGDQELLCVSDAVLHPVHLEQPEWHAVVDVAPRAVAATRRRLMTRASTDRALVLAFHFPFPGLGYVMQWGEAWRWQPIEGTG